MIIKIERKLDYFVNNVIVSLTTICAIALFLRLYYFPYGIPLTLDATSYFWYAIDTNILGHFPTQYKFPNTGWPTLLSVFFTIFHSNNFVDYMTLQRLITVSVSIITIIPVYLLCRKFFNKTSSLIGAALFGFEPHIIQNSTLGITDPLYILLVITSFVLLQCSNKKLVYVSFIVAALGALVRYEGMLFIVVLTIIFFIRFRKEKKTILKYILALSIYVLVLLPILYLRVQDTGNDGLTSHIIAGAIVTNKIVSSQSDTNFGSILFVANGLQNLFMYIGWIMIPYFVIFVPIGIILGFQKRNLHYNGIVLSMIILAIPALYAYTREIQETRYLLILIPFFSILSLFAINSIANKTNRRKLFFILLILGIFASSWTFLELKKSDLSHEREAYAIAQQVAKTTKVINDYYPESKYLKVSTINNKEFPILSEHVSSVPTTLSIDDFNSLEEFIQNKKTLGLSELVIDNKTNRPNFLKEVFDHEEKYPYLIRIYDSLDYGYNYHVKIYKINYEKFALITK